MKFPAAIMSRYPFPRICRLTLVPLFVLLFAGASASAQLLTGMVKNSTTNKPAAGDDVVLIKLTQGMEEAARIVCHMTAEQAAGVATAAGAQALALVHLSTAYKDDGRVQREAHAAFARTVLTPHDGEVYEIVRSRRTRLRRVPPRLALP